MTQSKPVQALALVGMAGSGKTLCAEHLQSKGYYQFRFGSIVTDEVERRGLAINPANEKTVRLEFRANEGMDVMAKRALPKLREALETRDSIIIDGLYSFSEYKTLSAEFPDSMVLVAINTPKYLRYQRLAARPHRPLTVDEATERDWNEIEKMEKGGPIAIADYTLINDGTAEELLAKLDALLMKLGVST